MDDHNLEVVGSCCFGDTISAGGSCEAATIIRVRAVWGKFRKICTCVRIAMLYGSECWPLKRTDLFQLKRNVREINVTAVMPHIDRKFLWPQHSLQQAGFD